MRRPGSRAAAARRHWRRHGQLVVWCVVGALVALLLAVFSAGLFLYAVLVVGLALGLALLFASVAIRHVDVRRELGDPIVAAGQSVGVTLTVSNRKPLPVPWLYCEDRVEDGLDVVGGTAVLSTVAGDGSMTLRYEISASRRGLYRVGPSFVETSDPMGLVRRFRMDRQPEFLTVTPRVRGLGAGWPLGRNAIHRNPRRRSLFEDPARFVGVRDYRPSDSIRRIHWRATARRRTLQVKTFEPSVLQGALLLVDGAPADDEVFELTVTAAASVADHVLGEGQRVGLLSNGGDAAERYPRQWQGETLRRLEDVMARAEQRHDLSGFRPLEVEAGRGDGQRGRVLAALARLVPAAGVTLAQLIEVEMPRLPRDLVAIVVTRAVDDALALALDGLRRAGVEVSLIWIRPYELDGTSLPLLPRSVPVHAIADELQLEDLGERAL